MTQADVDGNGSINDSATASGTPTVGYFSYTSTATVTVTQKAALTVDKTSTTKSVTTVGQIVNYSFLVTDTGNVDIRRHSVVDTQAVPSLNLLQLSPITCPSTTLAAGASMTCTATYTVTQADLGSLTTRP